LPRRLIYKGKEAMRRILILLILPVVLAVIGGGCHTCDSCCNTSGSSCDSGYGSCCGGGDLAPVTPVPAATPEMAPPPVDKKDE
jgi:hypothetical protein